MQHVYKYIDEYNPENRCKIFLVLDDMISDMVSNKKTSCDSNWTIY